MYSRVQGADMDEPDRESARLHCLRGSGDERHSYRPICLLAGSEGELHRVEPRRFSSIYSRP
jgi:hypothetical protein